MAAKRRRSKRAARRSRPRSRPRRKLRRRRVRRPAAVTVTLQIVPRGDDDLLALVRRWVDEEAHTLYFTARRPRLRLEHKSPRYPGRIELHRRGTLLMGEARAPGGVAPWGIVEKFVGRMIDKLASQVSSVNIQIHGG